MPADLKELRRLHEAATPGPWYEQYEYDGSRTVCQMRSTSETICVNRATHVSGRPWERAKENGMLIAAARNALPELLDRLEAAEAEVARLRENGLRLVKALDRIDNHACSGEAQYGCRYCSKSGDIAREALEGR